MKSIDGASGIFNKHWVSSGLGPGLLSTWYSISTCAQYVIPDSKI